MKRKKINSVVIIIICLISLWFFLKNLKNTNQFDLLSIQRLNSKEEFSGIANFQMKLKRKTADNDCKKKEPKLIGKLNLTIHVPKNFNVFSFKPFKENISDLLHLGLDNVKHGGSYEPTNCNASSSLAFIIPYKNRLDNLNVFLYNMHSYLQRQLLKYTIFVVEQVAGDVFNKGVLNNAAFIEIFLKKNEMLKTKTKHFKKVNDKNIQIEEDDYYDYDCVMFHDVDLLPTDDLNIYSCPERMPRHYSIIVDENDYRIIWPHLIGGAIIFGKEHYIKVNGYSNTFWGWGGEDDNMHARLLKTNVSFDRPLNNTKYTMLSHNPTPRNPNRFKLLERNKHQDDGLNSQNFYKLNGIVKYPLFTHLLVDVGSLTAE